jgi:hypothetical protein
MIHLIIDGDKRHGTILSFTNFLPSRLVTCDSATTAKLYAFLFDCSLMILGMANADAPPLLLMGRRYPFHFSAGDFKVGNVAVYVEEEFNTSEGTGLTVWDGSIVLAKWMESLPRAALSHAVLELGCGTGLVGMAAAALGSPCVTLTDLPYALKNTQRTVAANSHISSDCTISVQELDWLLPHQIPPAGIVLAADVAWVEELVQPLIGTLKAATAGQLSTPIQLSDSFPWLGERESQHPVVFLSYQSRSTRVDEAMLVGLSEAFHLHKVPDEQMPTNFNPSNITVYVLTRRSQDVQPSLG